MSGIKFNFSLTKVLEFKLRTIVFTLKKRAINIEE